MSGPLVMKFGGTSVGTATAMKQAAGIIAKRAAMSSPLAVVVSAMAGVTDALVSACQAARSGAANDASRTIALLRTRHVEVAEGLFESSSDRERVLEMIGTECGAVQTALASPAGRMGPSDAEADAVLATGELISSRMLAAVLAAAGVPVQWVDSRRVIVTSDLFGSALPLPETTAAAQTELIPVLRAGAVAVLPGFIGATKAGATTTLGRGASDFSASIIGAAIDAVEIQLWTDVDGMLTSDPRIVAGAMPVDRLSFDEASELAYFGAKVLHPSTIFPAVEKNIPVRILNTMRPQAPGSLISADPPARDARVAALACRRRITLIHITSTRVLPSYEFMRRVFEVFERHVTSVDVVTTAEVSVSVTVHDHRRLDAITRELAEFASVHMEPGMASISAVGERLREDPAIAVAVIRTLGHFPIRMVSQAASRRNVTVVLSDEDVPAAMTRLHEELFTAVGARR